MRRDHHVGGPLGDRVVDDAGVDLLQAVGIGRRARAPSSFILRAKISPDGVIELQIAAAGVVERLDRLAIGLAEILIERFEIGIDRFEIDLRPPRKCSTAGDGIVILAVTCAVSACFFRKRNDPASDRSSGKSSLPITRMASCRVCTPAN